MKTVINVFVLFCFLEVSRKRSFHSQQAHFRVRFFQLTHQRVPFQILLQNSQIVLNRLQLKKTERKKRTTKQEEVIRQKTIWVHGNKILNVKLLWFFLLRLSSLLFCLGNFFLFSFTLTVLVLFKLAAASSQYANQFPGTQFYLVEELLSLLAPTKRRPLPSLLVKLSFFRHNYYNFNVSTFQLHELKFWRREQFEKAIV